MSRRCQICDGNFSCRQSLWKHMKTHEKECGEGLRTQTVNDQMKWGYGLKSKHDKGVGCSGDESETDSDSDTDAESSIDSSSVHDSSSSTPLSCLDFKPYLYFI